MGISKPTLYAYVRAADLAKIEPDPADRLMASDLTAKLWISGSASPS